VVLLISAVAMSRAVSAADPGKVEFNRDIRPILSENCFKCHGPGDEERKAKLRFDLRGEALKPAKSGNIAIVPGAPEKSELVARITASDPDDRMPPLKTGKTLRPAQIELLRRWIAQGAPYATHWAYVRPVRPALPAVRKTRWPRNPIDRFILARLERERLAPSARADRPTLIRRVSLDLTGLPPTLAEVNQFLQDKNPRAYEDLVERLLSKPAFGEHWARMWLDLARYADSAGYADDPPRTIWAFRDYVIKSFNANKPFDRFTIEQIAGDLLDDSDEETETATAFHRNTMTNNEGGTSDEEFRNAAVVDRVNTTMSVWMGTTMACAQCHTHKYDPLTQKEYFQFFAFFNNSEDADRQDEAPVRDFSTKAQKEQRENLQAEIARIDTRLAATTNRPPADTTKTAEHPSPALPESSASETAADLQADRDRLQKLKTELAAMTLNTVPVMRELTGDKRRTTHIEFRGNYLALGDEVSEAVPAVFHPLPPDAPLNRLTLARWLVDEDNPLTARVVANRFWEQIFGTGIVRTCEDFGTQGDRPTHPELLDWVATELVAEHWNVKEFLKLLVTSATYCQSSAVTPSLQARDPDNVLLARGPRFRASAEVVRDQALAVSGLLSPKMYGPSVRPPQSSLGLSAAFGSSLDWKTSEGEDRYRRALYVEWRRTNPYASMATFDAPSREVCTLRRPRSNTPLQALVTLNDPVYVEAARALGHRMAEAAGSTADRLTYGFRLCLARSPRAKELSRLLAFYREAEAEYVAKPQLAEQMASPTPEASPAAGEASELAAWAAVGNVLLNLDEMLMKP
jgi:mono/diheme cytochrome c family protein